MKTVKDFYTEVMRLLAKAVTQEGGADILLIVRIGDRWEQRMMTCSSSMLAEVMIAQQRLLDLHTRNTTQLFIGQVEK